MKETKNKKQEKKPNKFKKLGLIFGCLAICAIFVTATVITYYGKIEQQVTVEQSVMLGGENCNEGICDVEMEGIIKGGENVVSDLYTLQSQTSVDVPATIVTTVNPDEYGIETKYYGELDLVHKIVVFGNEPWEIDDTKSTAKVKYSFVDDVFLAEVVEGNITGYKLIYYKDNSNRFNNPATAIDISEIEGNLPYDTDGNKDEYDYCITGEYDTCHGAKIWYVPVGAIDVDGNIDWSKASNFLYETKLIKYFDNTENEIVVSPGDVLDFYTETSFSTSNKGSYAITTEIEVQ